MTSLQEHLKGIAQKGGLARAKKTTKKQRQEWGKKGGRPHKNLAK